MSRYADIETRWVPLFDRIDQRIAGQLSRISILLMRFGLGLVFVWFGALKVAGVSPAAELVARTTDWAFNPAWFLPMLGWWEVLIGLCLLDPLRVFAGRAWLTRLGILLLALQIPGTFLPLFVVPERCFDGSVFVLTLEGQYIVKNLVLIAGAIALGATVRKP
ncbi:MAG: hypothetical protein AB8F26_00170 [Phycisphaerales bacterium]